MEHEQFLDLVEHNDSSLLVGLRDATEYFGPSGGGRRHNQSIGAPVVDHIGDIAVAGHLYPLGVVGQHEGDPRLPPGPRGLSREFVQAHQRERIINGMVAAVDAKGYMATSVADVLARARVSRSAFYEQFRDKEDCFLASYDLGARLLFDAVTAALATGGAWQKRVRRVYEALLNTFAQHAQLARVCMVEALAAGPAANLRYRQALAGFVSLIEADIAANPDYPRVPRALIFGLVGGSSATIYEEIAAGRTTELPQLVDDLTKFALAAFVGYFPATRNPIEQLSPGGLGSRHSAPRR